MLERFVCPDMKEINMKDCLEKCRLNKRCLTKPTLMVLARVRPWKGIPSVTQLLNGTYESFLKIKVAYAESPDQMAFRLYGTVTHANLEEVEVDESLMIEISNVGSDGISGTSDLVEKEDNWHILTDYKTSGSFKVAKALGAYETWGESKDEVYKQKTYVTFDGMKVAREKGSPKIKKKIKFDIKNQDCKDWIYQLNKYRIDLEENGTKIDEIRIQAIVRDGGTMIARNRGLDRNIYLIPIPHIKDEEIKSYFKKKKENLLKALEMGDWNEECSEEETWNGLKCERYCSVSKFCKFKENING